MKQPVARGKEKERQESDDGVSPVVKAVAENERI